MDLNYLYLRRQVSLVRADRAACDASRSSHLGLACLYDRMIERKRPHRKASRRIHCAGDLAVAA